MLVQVKIKLKTKYYILEICNLLFNATYLQHQVFGLFQHERVTIFYQL